MLMIIIAVYLSGLVVTGWITLGMAAVEIDKAIEKNRQLGPEQVYAMTLLTRVATLALWPVLVPWHLFDLARQRLRPHR